MKEQSRPGVTGMDRRHFLQSAAGGAALAASGVMGRQAFAQGKTISMAGYGGIVQEHQTRLFAQPFEKKTGIKVNIGSGASLALAKLQNSSGTAAQWDIISLSGPEYLEAIEQKLIVPYDYSIIESKNIPPTYKMPYGVPFSLYLYVMAWDTRQVPNDKAPQTWADFFNPQKYPGKRSLYANISDGSVLEGALLADGVALDKLYPLDIDRALKVLDRLGKQNIIWHTTNAEPMQHLTSGAAALATCFNGRAITVMGQGGPVNYTSNFGGVSGNPYCVVASSANKKEAFQFLNYMLNTADADAEYITLTNYAIPNTEALKLVSKEVLDKLPNSEALKDKVFVKNDEWWAKNLAKSTARFKEWQLS